MGFSGVPFSFPNRFRHPPVYPTLSGLRSYTPRVTLLISRHPARAMSSPSFSSRTVHLYKHLLCCPCSLSSGSVVGLSLAESLSLDVKAPSVTRLQMCLSSPQSVLRSEPTLSYRSVEGLPFTRLLRSDIRISFVSEPYSIFDRRVP